MTQRQHKEDIHLYRTLIALLSSSAIKVLYKLSAFIALGTKEKLNLLVFTLGDVYFCLEGRRTNSSKTVWSGLDRIDRARWKTCLS